MKPLAVTAAVFAAFLMGMACASPQVKTERVLVPGETVTLPATEKVIHDPTDAVRIGELEAEAAANLDGWRKAEARYKYYETYWQPKQTAQPVVGGQGSPSRLWRRR